MTDDMIGINLYWLGYKRGSNSTRVDLLTYINWQHLLYAVNYITSEDEMIIFNR